MCTEEIDESLCDRHRVHLKNNAYGWRCVVFVTGPFYPYPSGLRHSNSGVHHACTPSNPTSEWYARGVYMVRLGPGTVQTLAQKVRRAEPESDGGGDEARSIASNV